MLIELLLAAAPPATCPVERARYEMRARPSITARFHRVVKTEDWRTGLALEIRIGASGRTYWFLPWNGGTNGKTNVRWVQELNSILMEETALDSDLDFFSTDAAYVFHGVVPTAGDAAPAHLFLPDLGYALWYRTPGNRRDSAERSFFDLTDCAPPSPVGAGPDIAFPPVP
jgi:hypothetical protein